MLATFVHGSFQVCILLKTKKRVYQLLYLIFPSAFTDLQNKYLQAETILPLLEVG